MGCAEQPAKPTATQPKGQLCLFCVAPRAALTPPPRQGLPSRGCSTPAPSSCPPAMSHSPPLGPSPHTAAGVSPPRWGHFWLQPGLRPGLPTMGEHFVQHPQHGGARTLVAPPEVALAPSSWGLSTLPEPRTPPDLLMPSARHRSSDAPSSVGTTRGPPWKPRCTWTHLSGTVI